MDRVGQAVLTEGQRGESQAIRALSGTDPFGQSPTQPTGDRPPAATTTGSAITCRCTERKPGHTHLFRDFYLGLDVVGNPHELHPERPGHLAGALTFEDDTADITLI